jgi:hypothetical protein
MLDSPSTLSEKNIETIIQVEEEDERPFPIPKNSTSGRRVCRHRDLCRPSVVGGRLLADCER